MAGAILAGSLIGALLLFVAEFTTLFYVHAATSSVPIREVATGSHNAYGLIPIAMLAAALAIGVFRTGSRPALLAIGVLGIISLLIGLLGDLPDAHASGLVGSAATHYVNATTSPSAGMYMETLGSIALILTCGLAFLLMGPPAPHGGRVRREASGPGE